MGPSSFPAFDPFAKQQVIVGPGHVSNGRHASRDIQKQFILGAAGRRGGSRQMNMHVRQAGNEKTASAVDDDGARRHANGGGGSDGLDERSTDDDRLSLCDFVAVHRDRRDVLKHGDRRRLIRCCTSQDCVHRQ